MSVAACPEPVAPLGLPMPSDVEFRLIQKLVYGETGIYLGEEKRELVAARLARRILALGASTLGAYYRRVKRDPTERVRMFDCLTTNETRFFREPHQFTFLQSVVFPAWEKSRAAAVRPRKHVRVWCVGCSSGEEPYSVAMALLERLRSWRIEILATDLSTRVLARAEAGLWPLSRAEEIPSPYLKRFMLKGRRSQEGQMKVGPELRAVVTFQRHNVYQDELPRVGPFQLVFCRNVLIYFSPESRRRVLDRLTACMAPGALLFLGHAESLGNRGDFRAVMPSVYARRNDARAEVP